MNSWLTVAAVLLPIAGGILIPILPFRRRIHMEWYIEALVIATSVLVWCLLLHRPEELVLLRFTDQIVFTLRIDGLGTVFAGLISVLWPLAILYSYEYMTHEERERPFFMFYTATFGVTLGIAFAGNILTMYFFYELLTLVTIPLVIHTFTRDAVLAARKYIYFSMGGAAFGFIAVVFLLYYGGNTEFVLGGFLGSLPGGLNFNLVLAVFVIGFIGFSVKAAMFPFYSWLPDAGAAPTPVTALLHAVAVVKAGAFAVIRLTYYCFGTEMLIGTWAQKLVLSLAMFTIVFGCSMAVRETHLKRRLAFSTVSNLSYIIFGAAIMTTAGLAGALCHMVFHAIMKISAFFCSGAIMHQTDHHFIPDMDGFGRKMPWVYGAFTVSALGMMGVPGCCGFISKWLLAEAAIGAGTVWTWIGVAALLISALLTAIYMMTFVVRGFFPGKDFDYEKLRDVRDPNWKMILPLAVFSIAIVGFGLYSTPLTEFLSRVAAGLI
ncbi:complex I subunit 5 family protein [Hespellia stercorisuis]|uniref:Multicomponent Na+:H+ antiporter subunit D n=1 Tax=Hespellia stercorisuis DSM 15480 TaxID=1121950 RepID=A0A1M6HK54_9FIRM|nr:proton-conducting transporter membrane subunit [Hespellia stercorisuis]SHJ22547.1 multicomponent Na+:H+ antiporter subunit D [Hespellia stercorisuis DSM 15480]